MKTIACFNPVSTQPVAESERYYVEVHTRYARHWLRQAEGYLSYHTNRVVRQYDIFGTWHKPPGAWRFVILRTAEGRSSALPPTRNGFPWRDHPNCLKDLRRFDVEEQVLVNRLTAQTALEKYLFEIDRAPGTPVPEAAARLSELAALLTAELQGAFGVRLLVLNRVLRESVTEPVVEAGQRLTGRFHPETLRLAYLEFYFDHEEWGDEFFARPGVREALQDPFYGAVNGYHVQERCGFDHR